MFQQTFVPEVRSGRKPIGIAVSLITQSLLVALLALAPLFVSQPMPTAQLRSLFLGPTPPIAPEKPITRATTTAQTNIARVHSFRLTAPVVIPKQINTSAELAPEAPDITEVTGFNVGRESLLGGLGGSSNSVAPPMPKEQPGIKREDRPAPDRWQCSRRQSDPSSGTRISAAGESSAYSGCRGFSGHDRRRRTDSQSSITGRPSVAGCSSEERDPAVALPAHAVEW